MDINNFTKASRKIMQEASNIARDNQHQHTNVIHFLTAIINSDEQSGRNLLTNANASLNQIKNLLNEEMNKIPIVKTDDSKFYLDAELLEVIKNANSIAKQNQDSFIALDTLIIAIASSDNSASRILQTSGLNLDILKENVKNIRLERGACSDTAEDTFQTLEKYCIDLTELASMGKLDPVIGRDAEIRRIMQVLTRRTNNNPLLVGDTGVGKTAIAEGLANRIANKDAPESIKNASLLSLDIGALLAGAKYRGEFEERVKNILHEIENSKKNIILFIDEIHNLMGAGKTDGSIDASNLLKPALARGKLHCIGATTIKEYKKYVEQDAAFARRFQNIYVNQPSIDDTVSILRGLKEKYELFHGIKISDQAIVAAAKLSERYINHKFLPDKAINLIDEAASRLRITIDTIPEELDNVRRKLTQLKIEKEALKKEIDPQSKKRLNKIEENIEIIRKQDDKLYQQWSDDKVIRNTIQKYKKIIDQYKDELIIATRKGDFEKASKITYDLIPKASKKLENIEKDNILNQHKEIVTKNQIAEIVAKSTGIPVSQILQDEKQKLINMEKYIHQDVIEQKEAISAVCRAIRRSRTGLKEKEKPIGSFLFIGPTGVGKTELAKSIAKFLFDDKNSILRIDMSEYSEKHSGAKLIGAPPGYVGYEEGGMLTEKIRTKPYQVILLDEIEKANNEIFNLLLQLLDDGRLTDGKGIIVDFSNTIIIMTSNIGAEYLASYDINQIDEIVRHNIMKQVKNHFRPEFINRLDNIVIFHKLQIEHMTKIANIQIKKLISKLKEQDIDMHVKPGVAQFIGNKGYDNIYGARPLKRVIQNILEDQISDYLLQGKIKEGDKISLTLKNDKIKIIINETNKSKQK